MRIAITGVAGFIGSSIAERAIHDGHDVVGIDALTDYYDVGRKRANLRRLVGPQFTFHNADLLQSDLGAILSGVEVIFHQAGQPGVRGSWGNQFHVYTALNINATQVLLEAARDIPNLRRFVYASSSSVYGDAESYPTFEHMVPSPKSPYGVTKLAAEHLRVLYAKNYGVPTTSLRYFTVYGPRQRPDMAFSRFLRAACSEEQITVFGDGEQVRDFTYVDDVVEANIRAADTPSLPGLVVNVAGGSQVSVNQVLAEIASITGKQLRIRFAAEQAGDVRRTCGAIDLARREFGWEPNVTLSEGLRQQVQWLTGQAVKHRTDSSASPLASERLELSQHGCDVTR